MNDETRNYEMKPLEEMNVIDDFLFTEIMADEENGIEVCRIILSCVLKREIGNIHFTAQKVVPGVSEQSHGIRLDAYVTEESGEDISVYDVEPDKKSANRKELPRRSRYYGDLIDIQLLNSGTDYGKLPELVTIFILSYDPFGENAMYYEAGTVIKTHPNLPYDDGIRRIYLYVNGDLPDGDNDGDKSIRNLLRYINESTDDNATDDATKKLNSIVKSTKEKKDIGIRYMKSWEREKQLKEEGRAEGIEEGRAEGRAEERANTERERQRADKVESELQEARERIAELEAKLAEKK